jgi:hypothetical protein
VNRAQSEAIGFVLVFSLIVASTGVVYVVGFSSLQDVRTAEQLTNVERAFDVLDDNMQDIARRGAPTRSTELSLGGGDLRVAGQTNITVRATYVSNGTTAGTIPIETQPITYTLDDTEIAYTSGAVVRSERSGAVMLSEPGWIVDDDRTVITLFDTSLSGPREGVGGDTTVLVVVGLNSRSVSSFATGPGQVNVSVTVESPRASAWMPFFEERGFVAVDDNPADGEITYRRVEVEEVHVQLVTASVEFDL